LPYLEAAQAQKHVTHNEAIRALDAIVQLAIIDRDLTAPPGTPSDGDRYLVASAATGAWTAKDGKVAVWQDGAWAFLTPREGWLIWVADEDVLLAYNSSSWVAAANAGASVASAHGAATETLIAEEEITLLGASVNSVFSIPAGAIVFAVSERVTETVTGATSFKVGISGETNKFGDLLGLTVGATNRGHIGPTGFYAPTPIVVTANGADFTGGKIRIACHYALISAPSF
jgi:hypothetical protein